jgi:outer membrane protein OmpA-like peptidoglycan-associated protein
MSTLTTFKSVGLALICMSLLAACASTPPIDPRVIALQDKLEALESNPDLASRGGEALKAAKIAVNQVSGPMKNLRNQEVAYRFYAADRLIQTAEMTARARLAEDRRKELLKEQERLVLEARTLEADIARQQAQQARQSAAEAVALREQALREAAEAERMRDEAKLAHELAVESQLSAENAADLARLEAEEARLVAQTEAERAAQARAEADAARAEMESMRGRLSELEAKQTERGLLITLGDVLFEFNKSELKPGSARNLLPLADVLKERTDQTVLIEGHTDSVGTQAYNLILSEKRAQSVERYLVEQGIDIGRITTKGLGPDFPVADNASAEGRQLNRRVEVILPNLK